MTRLTALSSPFLLGFDEIEKVLERAARAAHDGYPPYNIERLAATNGEASLRITLAVAGFRADELSVEVEASRLTIRGAQKDEAERAFLHRGIAARQFERTFALADGMEVTGATLESGLLSIDLSRPVADEAVRRIPIAERG